MQQSITYITLANVNLDHNAVPSWSRLVIVVSMMCLIVPSLVAIQVGPVLLRFTHVSMIVLGCITANKLLSGAVTIKVTFADWLMLIHVVLISFSSIHHNAFGQGGQTAVSIFIRMGLAYFVARVAICNLSCYRYYVRIVVVFTSVSAVFGIIEMFTGYSVIRALYSTIFPLVEYVQFHGRRYGLFRAQTTFRHAILYGLSSVIAFALAVYYKPNVLEMKPNFYKLCLALCCIGVFASLSSAPWMAMVLCIFCLLYSKFFKDYQNRWRNLVIFMIALFLFASVFSNRGPIKLLISYLTFNAQTGYVRLGMWESVLAMVPDYWPMGWGWGAGWPRLEWYMWESIDCYYALWFVRSGIFPIITIFGVLFHSLYRANKVARQTCQCTDDIAGWSLAMVTLFIVLFTVHVFGNLVTAVYFMLGAGQSLLAISNVMAKSCTLTSNNTRAMYSIKTIAQW